MMIEHEDLKDTLAIVATLNEEIGLGPTLTEVKESLPRPLCLIVDGRSTDRTIEVAKGCGAATLFQKEIGKGDTIATALSHTKGLNVKYVRARQQDSIIHSRTIKRSSYG